MANVIASIVLVLSFGGLAYLIGRKIPLLLAFPAKTEGFSKENFVKTIKRQIQNSKIAKLFLPPEVFLQTLLSKIRILSLRLETKTSEWLMNLRKKAQKKNGKFTGDYWDKLKKK